MLNKKKKNNHFDLIVFDWDGTLMDSTYAIVHSIQAACADLALPVPSNKKAAYVIGLSITDAFRVACPEATTDQPAHLRQTASTGGWRRAPGW